MLETLKFVQGAVARKDFVPALTHFRIANGVVKGYNGALAICSPIDLNLEATPKAVPFINAIQKCKDTVQLNMTPAKRLAVKSGGFRAYIDCLEQEDYPDIEPEGVTVPLTGPLMKALRAVAPFIADDASRPWARGILFRGPSCLATNNISLIEHWLGYNFPVEINVPQEAVNELLRVDEEPVELQICDTSVTFHYASGRWIRTQTYETGWPDIQQILDRPSEPKPLPPGLSEALDNLAPFVDELGRVHFLDGAISTSAEQGDGASVEFEGLPALGCFNIKQLRLLANVAKEVDFTMYPKPCIFYGELIRGAIMGLRV